MTLFKNKLSWKRWANRVNRGQPQSPIDAPIEFPCFGYLITQSFGYEEEQAVYLYNSDVIDMLKQIAFASL